MLCISDHNTNSFTIDIQKVAMFKAFIGADNYCALDKAERQILESANWNIRTIDRANTILAQSEVVSSISIILSGWSFAYRTLADGKRQIVDFTLAGTLLGFGANRIAQHGVETITPCVIGSLPISQFYSLLGRCPHFAVHLAECIVDSELRAHSHLTQLGRRSARERVAALIVELTTRSKLRKTSGSDDGQDLPLTLAMIADALGLTCEHVCRTLAKLFEDGVVELKRQSLHVLNSNALAREAGVDHVLFSMSSRKLEPTLDLAA